MRIRLLPVLLVPALLLPGAPALAQKALAEVWATEQRQGCRLAANPRLGHSLEWSGACRAGLAEGPGTLTGRNPDGSGSRIEGTMQAGRFNGPRRMVVTDRRGGISRITIEGPAEQGRLRGEITLPDGSRYRGEFRATDLRPDGRGRMHYGSGASYEGGWREGLADGWGSARTAAGHDHVGLYRRGCLAEGGPLVGSYLEPITRRCPSFGGPTLPVPGSFEDRARRATLPRW